MNQATPIISIAIPVYNVENFLPRCIDSVLNQTFQDFEIVCVNDASPDNSLQILKDYKKRDSRIKIIDKANNEGLMRARHTGYQNAGGQYVFFLDSDDFIPSDALESLLNKAVQADADITVGNMALVNPQGRQVIKQRAALVGDSARSYLRSTLNWNTPSLCGSLFKRSLFDNCEYTALMNHGYSEDRILLTEILTQRNPRISSIDQVTYYYWMNSGSITHSKPTDKAVTEQFKALYNSYDTVQKADWGLDCDNNGFMIRYLSLYIERGCDVNLLKSIDSRNNDLLRFGTMKRYVGTRLATHTWLCANFPPYRHAMHATRLLIRKLQGKY